LGCVGGGGLEWKKKKKGFFFFFFVGLVGFCGGGGLGGSGGGGFGLGLKRNCRYEQKLPHKISGMAILRADHEGGAVLARKSIGKENFKRRATKRNLKLQIGENVATKTTT